MKHKDLWRALDTLAAEHGLSVSGLARRSGLDPTTFIPAKRKLPDGRTRWPSTESLAKVLEATRTSLSAFSLLVAGARTLPRTTGPATRQLPLVSLRATAADASVDTREARIINGRTSVSVPSLNDSEAYAFAVPDDQMAPVFRSGDIIVASPAAPVRIGDRVVVRLAKGTLLARELVDRAAQSVVLRCFAAPSVEMRVDPSEVVFIHRVVWASQ